MVLASLPYSIVVLYNYNDGGIYNIINFDNNNLVVALMQLLRYSDFY